MTAYSVPLSVHIASNTTEGVSNIRVNGLELKSLYDYFIDVDEMSEIELNKVKEISDEIGEEHLFVKVRTFDESVNDSITIRIANFFVNVSPKSATTITISINAVETIELWTSVPDEYDNSRFTKAQKSRHKGPVESFCCYHERIECIADAASMMADYVALLLAAVAPTTAGASGVGAIITEIAGCASSAISTTSSFSATLACDRDKSMKDKLFSFNGLANGISAIGALASCGAFKKLKLAADVVVTMGRGVTVPASIMNCSSAWKKKPNCPPKPPGGGSSTPYTPIDPNDIFGYLSESGNHFIADSVSKVNYTIEFENDATLANAAAHTIVIRDTLDSRYFDLKAFMPTSIKLGSKEEFLGEQEVTKAGGKTNFVKTIDMRPEINAIAQVEGSFNGLTGIAEWRFTSLDPMTMEPTDDLMQGILPVNHDGTSGIGEVMFEIGMRQGKLDGSEVNNRASIIFDYEAPILTPTWTNIVDAVPPVSTIADVTMENDTIARLHIAGQDNRSGIWYYDIYAQMGKGTMWVKVGEHVTEPEFDYRVYEGIDYGFCVLAVDSAGNVEKKELRRDWPYDPNVPTSTLSVQGDSEGNVEPMYDLSGKPIPVRQKGIYVQKGRKRLLHK